MNCLSIIISYLPIFVYLVEFLFLPNLTMGPVLFPRIPEQVQDPQKDLWATVVCLIEIK